MLPKMRPMEGLDLTRGKINTKPQSMAELINPSNYVDDTLGGKATVVSTPAFVEPDYEDTFNSSHRYNVKNLIDVTGGVEQGQGT